MKLPNFIQENPTKSLVLLSSLASAAFLATALIGQYGFNLHPCELCIAQRVPYVLILLVGVVACLSVKSDRVMEKMLWLCILFFLIDGGIAIYHSGVELGVVTGPSGCTNNDKPGSSIEEMRAALLNAQLVPCDQPMAYLFGLSMASWNAFAAMFSAIFIFVMLKKTRKYKNG